MKLHVLFIFLCVSITSVVSADWLYISGQQDSFQQQAPTNHSNGIDIPSAAGGTHYAVTPVRSQK